MKIKDGGGEVNDKASNLIKHPYAVNVEHAHIFITSLQCIQFKDAM